MDFLEVQILFTMTIGLIPNKQPHKTPNITTTPPEQNTHSSYSTPYLLDPIHNSGISLDMYICIHVRDKRIYQRGI
jgi:hypothetical protein